MESSPQVQYRKEKMNQVIVVPMLSETPDATKYVVQMKDSEGNVLQMATYGSEQEARAIAETWRENMNYDVGC